MESFPRNMHPVHRATLKPHRLTVRAAIMRGLTKRPSAMGHAAESLQALLMGDIIDTDTFAGKRTGQSQRPLAFRTPVYPYRAHGRGRRTRRHPFYTDRSTHPGVRQRACRPRRLRRGDLDPDERPRAALPRQPALLSRVAVREWAKYPQAVEHAFAFRQATRYAA